MADRTGIEWTDATWNPVRGCTRVSEACRHCFAEGFAARFSDTGAPYHGIAERGRTGSKWTGKVEVAWHLIELPLIWRKPRLIFVNSMSDLFHDALPRETIATIFAVMVAAVHLRGHTLQVLTKRSHRMRQVLSDPDFWKQVNAEACAHVMDRTDPLQRRAGDARAMLDDYGPDKPPPGIWLGVSVEDQPSSDARIPDLEATPAAVRFVSFEPLLGPVDFRGADIDLAIVGGESGSSHDIRPMHPEWVRHLHRQCLAIGVAFFFKQWGEFAPVEISRNEFLTPAPKYQGEQIAGPGGRFTQIPQGDRVTVLRRFGKRRAGNMLDGRRFLELPA